MAVANVKTVVRKVPTEVTEKVVKLELSEDEASVLRTLVGRVAGDPDVSTRKYTDAIGSALARAGVPSDSCCHFRGGTVTAMRA